MHSLKDARKRDHERTQLRLVAWVIALVIACSSWLFAHGQVGLLLDISAALVFAIGTVWPRTLRWLVRGLWSIAFLVRGRRQGV